MVTMMNTRVNPASKIVSAISLVFLAAGAFHQRDHLIEKTLSHFSSDLHFDLIAQHLGATGDTALSPPASRITGALSPVMALSSMVARPSMISPSEGMISPASQMNTSPFTNRDEGTIVISFTYISPTTCRSLAGVSSWSFSGCWPVPCPGLRQRFGKIGKQ